MDALHYLVAAASGFAAGVVNTLAGSGSMFTLPMLLFLGLSPHMANGTNRVGVLLQTLVGALTLYRNGKFRPGADLFYIIPAMAGSALGAWLATSTGEQTLRITIAVIMVLVLALLLYSYKALVRPADEPVSKQRKRILWPVLFLIGAYGGFIQLGVGILMLSALMLILKFSSEHANALKNIMNFFLTVPAFFLFAWKGHIQWETGLVVASGQAAGAYVSARWYTTFAGAAGWIRALLIAMTALTSMKLFGLF